MEGNLNGRQPQWKTTSIEDDLNRRQTQWKTTSMEDNLNGRQPQWRTISMEDNLNGRQPQWKMTTLACLTSQFCSELGPSQPQLIIYYCFPICFTLEEITNNMLLELV